jgi:hypothetical protein
MNKTADDAGFRHRISEALELGWALHGSPAISFGGVRLIVAQALLWADKSRRPRERP